MWATAPSPLARGSLRGRVPVAIRRSAAGRYDVGWSQPARSLLTTPMYDWAVSRRDLRFTDLDVLLEYGMRFDAEKLRGCIFHVSRCGSTAIANAFRSAEHMLVISEARGLSAILLAPEHGGIEVPRVTKRLLALGFIGAIIKECPATAVTVKLPSFASIDIAGILNVLPPVRWCFSSRQPREVMRSLDRSPAGWLRDERGRAKLTQMLGLAASSDGKPPRMSDLNAHLLERYFAAALSAMSPQAIWLDYSEFGVESVAAVVQFVLGAEIGGDALLRLAGSLSVYSKSLEGRTFVPDEPLERQDTGFPALDQTYERYRVALNSGAFNAAAGIVKAFEGSL